MDKEATVTRFLAISEFYFKMTEQTEKVISDDEVELLLAKDCFQYIEKDYRQYRSSR